MELKFLLVAALVGDRRAGAAAPLYRAARDLARNLGEAAPARAIAVASNNLATDLLEAPTRTPDEAAVMRLAADAAHEFWLRCGAWENDERGRYLQALVANVLGEADAALGHVRAALAIIDAHAPQPVDAAFLHLAAAHARHLLGEAAASAAELSRSDAIAAGWDDPGLVAWHAEERARVFPDQPPRGG